MIRFITGIYDYLSGHRRVLWISMVLVSLLSVLLIFKVRFSENISDFLPLGSSQQEALAVYQNISGANRLYILFSNPDDADGTVEAIDAFESYLLEADSLGWCSDLVTQFDISRVREITNFVYANVPYFLTEEDYARMDSLLAQPGYVQSQMERNREMLMFPTGGMMVSNIVNDPLALFTPLLSRLQESNPQMSFEMYDGYIFTPDMSRAVVMMNSPFGNSETEYNSKLLAMLYDAIGKMEGDYPQVKAHVVGGPEIAVGNSTRIKKDSLIAISLSVVLIIMLVAYSIGSLRNILLIFLSIGWGWLFAMGGMSIFGGDVSIIVIGISSVVLGIAVNYPLHLIVHLGHNPDVRMTIKEIMAPLVIGNITTVSAFLTLIPLQSAALRDLGIFATLLLIGTILFVLLYLPHLVKVKRSGVVESKLIDRIAGLSPDRNRYIVWGVVVVTIFLSYFSLQTEFDSNMANINYMTQAQREDMQYFEKLLSNSKSSTTKEVYLLSSGSSFDEALLKNGEMVKAVEELIAEGLVESYKGVFPFLASKEEQGRRLAMWRDFVSEHKELLTRGISSAAMHCGFSQNAFAGFNSLVGKTDAMKPQDIGYFAPITSLLLSQNVTSVESTSKSYIVNRLNVEGENVEKIKSMFEGAFDVAGMNSALSKNLSDNFNYIGWACSIIVFIFLWFSFGRIELAIIAFLPMAVSWIWILGIMAIFGIKFNIVNVILATFIFGQGDDYTIFMTEGCQHEYSYRRPILASYKGSILQSALIMFVGIGTLIISKHPAMRSLAEVTIIGMLSVVLMSYIIPPFLFRWITTRDGLPRKYPLTLRSVLFGVPSDPVEQVIGRYIYKGLALTRAVRENLRKFDTAPVEGIYQDKGYGECAILMALLHPDRKVVARIEDDDRRRIAQVAADNFVDNIEFI